MTFIWLIVGSISLFYILLIGYFYLGWIKHRVYKNQKTDLTCFVSIIVAARNEEKNILNLLNALSLQTYKHYEVIIIDDHSTDNTSKLIRDNVFVKCALITLSKDQAGKKTALATAIPMSKGELILTTDADCVPDNKWVESMVAFYKSERVEFIIGPVKQIASKNFFQQLFSLDFLSLQATGAGAAEMKKPFMCNGANLAFSKTLWDNISHTNRREVFASGDDVFLLHNAITVLPKDKIRFIFSENAMVITSPPSGIKAFLNQRLRWASKAKGYKNITSIITSLIVLLINGLLLGLLFSSIFSHLIIYFFFFVLIVKSIVDFLLLYTTDSLYKQKKLLLYFVPLQFIYFIYITVISVFSLFKKYSWKERNCN